MEGGARKGQRAGEGAGHRAGASGTPPQPQQGSPGEPGNQKTNKAVSLSRGWIRQGQKQKKRHQEEACEATVTQQDGGPSSRTLQAGRLSHLAPPQQE